MHSVCLRNAHFLAATYLNAEESTLGDEAEVILSRCQKHVLAIGKNLLDRPVFPGKRRVVALLSTTGEDAVGALLPLDVGVGVDRFLEALDAVDKGLPRFWWRVVTAVPQRHEGKPPRSVAMQEPKSSTDSAKHSLVGDIVHGEALVVRAGLVEDRLPNVVVEVKGRRQDRPVAREDELSRQVVWPDAARGGLLLDLGDVAVGELQDVPVVDGKVVSHDSALPEVAVGPVKTRRKDRSVSRHFSQPRPQCKHARVQPAALHQDVLQAKGIAPPVDVSGDVSNHRSCIALPCQIEASADEAREDLVEVLQEVVEVVGDAVLVGTVRVAFGEAGAELFNAAIPCQLLDLNNRSQSSNAS